MFSVQILTDLMRQGSVIIGERCTRALNKPHVVHGDTADLKVQHETLLEQVYRRDLSVFNSEHGATRPLVFLLRTRELVLR